MKMIYNIIIVFAVCCLVAFSEETESSKYVLYTDIKPANRTESLLKLRNVPIVRYKFKFDSVADRYQLGIIGPDAQKYFAESIEVVPSQTFTSKDRSKPPAVVTNFPVVDKNVLFMHGLVAVQELIFRYEDLSKSIETAEEDAEAHKKELLEIEDRLLNGVSLYAKQKLENARIEAENAAKELELQSEKEKNEREILQQQLQHEKTLMEYEIKLTKERMQKQEEWERKNNEDILLMEKELAEKRELLARETNQITEKLKLQYDNDIEIKKLNHEKERIRIELESKEKQKRIEQEIELTKIQTKSKLETERIITTIKTISTQITKMILNIFEKPQQVAIFTAIILSLIALYYIIKEVFKVIRQYIQSKIGKPSLVRETSYTYSIFPSWVSNLFKKSDVDFNYSRKILDKEFDNIILSAEDKRRVLNLALATRNTKQSGAPYRHVLLHGAPGTGKTLIARRLAATSGMDYAIMSGGDVAPLGEDGVNQLHGLFNWANRSSKGLLVFIDEAEAFLAARNHTNNHSNDGLSDIHIRNALNALLYQTGTPSYNFMLILATNRPQDLDIAVLDRIDVSIPITPPAQPQRLQLIQYYMKEYVLNIALKSTQFSWKSYFYTSIVRTIEEKCYTDKILNEISIKTEGFSGREIAKLFIAVQYAMYLAPNSKLTEEIFMQTVDLKIEEHIIKKSKFIKNNHNIVKENKHNILNIEKNQEKKK